MTNSTRWSTFSQARIQPIWVWGSSERTNHRGGLRLNCFNKESINQSRSNHYKITLSKLEPLCASDLPFPNPYLAPYNRLGDANMSPLRYCCKPWMLQGLGRGQSLGGVQLHQSVHKILERFVVDLGPIPERFVRNVVRIAVFPEHREDLAVDFLVANVLHEPVETILITEIRDLTL